MTQPTLQEILQHPLEDVTRLVVRHERTATFRWLGLMEILLFGLVFCCCVVPVLLLLLVLSEGDADFGESELFSLNRLYYHWHDLVFTALNAKGETIASARVRLLSEQEGDPLLSGILQAADRQGVMVVEAIGDKTNTPAHLWFGGRPMLAEPGLPTRDRAAERLIARDCEIESNSAQTLLRFRAKKTAKVVLAVKVLGMAVFFPVLFNHSLRQVFWEAVAELKGDGPPVYGIEIRAEEIISRREQGGKVLSQQRIAGPRLISFAWSRELTYGDKAEIVGPHMRVAMIDGFEHLPVPSELGPELRDFLTRETLEKRAARPELGLTFGEPPPTRCPYCGALYIFMPGEGCPSCGGWPDKLG